MSNEVLTPPGQDQQTSKPAPEALHAMPQMGRPSADHLGIGGGLQEEGIFSSLIANVRDVFFPVKLPPLVLTSQPIAVPDRMKVKRSPASTATAIVVHALLLLLIGYLLYKVKVKFAPPVKVQTVDLNIPPIAASAPKAMGGGGGNHDIAPATKGLPPPPQKIQVQLMHPIIDHPKIAIAPSLDIQPMKMATSPINIGDINGPKVSGPSSFGPNGGNGLGPGHDNGLGPGQDAGYGGGAYTVGGGVSAPIALYTPEAEFSEEARRNKYQGNVDVNCIVDANGNVQLPHVVRDPGMGLAEKALEAVRTYRFKPGMLNGKPVAVRITVEVGFTIY